MYVQRVEIEHFRTFENAVFEPNWPGRPGGPDAIPNVTLILGNNGAGKTSVLRAVALTALAPVIASGSGYVPYSLVRRIGVTAPGVAVSVVGRPANLRGELILHAQDEDEGIQTSSLRLLAPKNGFTDRFVPQPEEAWHSPMWDEHSQAFFMVGYGANRRAETRQNISSEAQSKARALRYQRVASLFEESVALMPLSTWLPRWRSENPGRHKQVIGLMNALLEPHAEVIADSVDGEYLFSVRGSELPLGALSDGYRAYISWISDLLYHVCMGAPSGQKLVDGRGVVLVDEIDLHLHPDWQRQVIPTMARTLPNLQFIVTSHSPLVVGTLHRENVVVLESGDFKTTLSPASDEVYGLSADQILTSAHFGLASPRNEEFARRLEKQARAAQDDPEAALEFMRMMSLGAASERAEAPKRRTKRTVAAKKKSKSRAARR